MRVLFRSPSLLDRGAQGERLGKPATRAKLRVTSGRPFKKLTTDALARPPMTATVGKQRSPESLSAIKHQQAWLDKLVREDEEDSSLAPSPRRVAAPVSRKPSGFHKTKSGLSLSKVLKRSQLAAAGSRTQKLPPPASYRTTGREKASLSQRTYLDWLTLEHKHSGMSLQRSTQLRALFERCADDPTQLQRHGLHAAALLKASGHRRMLNTPSWPCHSSHPGIPPPVLWALGWAGLFRGVPKWPG